MWNPLRALRAALRKEEEGANCLCEVSPEQAENRGLVWVIGAFLLCPCHLPLTLGLAATLLSGTAAAALLRNHPYLAGAVITLVWLAATWRGVRLIRSARRCANAAMNRAQRTSPQP